MAAMLDLRHLGPSGRQNSSSITFPVSGNIYVDTKFAFLRYFFTESVIICSELFNMGRIGNFFIFKHHFDNVPNSLGFILLVCHKVHLD